MYGQVSTPTPTPTPSRNGPSAAVITVRVLITALTVVTFGFFSWIAMLRIAIMRRGRRDWALFWGQLVLNIACLATLEQSFADHWISDVGMAGLLVQMAAVTAYFLVVDIRHHQPAPIVLMAPPPPPYRPLGYAYGPDGAPVTTTPGGAPAPYVCAAPVPAQPPAAPRIEQVRAELDELSDLLRGTDREDGK
ncbi:hypothetical protein ACFXGT_14365 [Streptomyces sp. NPDC059352]|uniref:hypothetical protein n=1 Tax=Streptomyces sp. NPDC059352 TaxID=3346810 RepID=UPI00367BDCE6